MTNTRLLFYAAFAICPLWAAVAFAHPSFDGEPASAVSSALAAPKKTAPQVPTKASHVDAKAAAGTNKRQSASEASAQSPYHLSHTPHRLDSYQNAVTPPPSADER